MRLNHHLGGRIFAKLKFVVDDLIGAETWVVWRRLCVAMTILTCAICATELL
jgi:hypothetical protein